MMTPHELLVAAACAAQYPTGCGYDWGNGPLTYVTSIDSAVRRLAAVPTLVAYG